jgi:hypothetical protein
LFVMHERFEVSPRFRLLLATSTAIEIQTSVQRRLHHNLDALVLVFLEGAIPGSRVV